MQKLRALWQSIQAYRGKLKGRPCYRMPYWYLAVVAACAGFVEWAMRKMIDPGWTEFFAIWQDHDWDASATRCALLLGMLTVVWAYHFWLAGTHAAALFRKSAGHWR